MAAPSNDRNGVVVNRAMDSDSTTGIPNCLVEERCSEKAKIAVRRLVQKMSTAVVVLPYVQCATSTLVRPKSGFLQPSTKLYSATTGTH